MRTHNLIFDSGKLNKETEVGLELIMIDILKVVGENRGFTVTFTLECPNPHTGDKHQTCAGITGFSYDLEEKEKEVEV